METADQNPNAPSPKKSFSKPATIDQDAIQTSQITNPDLNANSNNNSADQKCFLQIDRLPPSSNPIAIQCFKSIDRKKKYLILYSNSLVESEVEPAQLFQKSANSTNAVSSSTVAGEPRFKVLPFTFEFAFYVKYPKQESKTTKKQHSAIKFVRLATKASETYYLQNEKTMARWVTLLTPYLNQLGVHQYYRMTKSLGKGVSGEVFLAERISDGKQFAVKAFNKIKNTKKCQDAFENEIRIMRLLNHPNIAKLYGVYVSSEYIYAVLEFLGGGTLYDEIKQVQKERQYYTKEQQFVIIEGLTLALEHLRMKRIIHRDLKLQNILIRPACPATNSSPEQPKAYVLCDFGLATWVDEETYIFQKCGTPGYIAPEILRTAKNQRLLIDCKVDVFSLGCIAHLVMLSRPVFHFNGDCKYLLKQNRSCEIEFRLDKYKMLQHNQLELLKGMLADEPSKRFSSYQMLKHPYFQQYKALSSLNKNSANISSQNAIIGTKTQDSSRNATEKDESTNRRNSLMNRTNDTQQQSQTEQSGTCTGRKVLRSTQRLGSVEVKQQKKTGFSRNPSLNKQIQFTKKEEDSGSKKSFLDFFFKKRSNSNYDSNANKPNANTSNTNIKPAPTTANTPMVNNNRSKPVSSQTLPGSNNLQTLKLKDSTASKQQIVRDMLGV